jgi:hypothetical protein
MQFENDERIFVIYLIKNYAYMWLKSKKKQCPWTGWIKYCMLLLNFQTKITESFST